MSGPSAIMIQGNFEAEIIEVEKHAAGDASRNIPRYLHEGESVYDISLKRNKKAKTLQNILAPPFLSHFRSKSRASRAIGRSLSCLICHSRSRIQNIIY